MTTTRTGAAMDMRRRTRDAWTLAALFALVPAILSWSWWTTALIILAALVSVRLSHLTPVVAVFGAAELAGLPWPVAPLLAAGTYLAFHRDVLSSRRIWSGPTGARAWEWVPLAFIGVAAGLVVVWMDRGPIVAGFVFPFRLPPLWLIPVAAGVLAAVNTVGEEFLWRVVLADQARGVAAPLMLVVMQAASFGVAHLHGIPDGPTGVVAAGVFSAVLYVLSRRYGVAGALLIHFAADIVIFLTIARHALFAWTG